MSRIASQIVRIPTLIILALVILGPVSATARNPLVDSLDVIVGDTVTVNVETENSVFVSPLNPKVLLVSNNHWEGQPLGRDGVSAWISDDAGHTWTNGSWVGLGSGDPACAISKASEPDGRFLVGQMDGEPYAHIVYYKDSSGGSWNPSPILSTHGEMPCIWVDNFSAGPYANYTYCGWTDGDVVVAHSTDGEQWTPSPITVPNGKYRGISLNTDSLGSVYAVWGELDQSTNAGKRIRFAKSTNGGEIWSYPTTTIYTLSGGCPENDCITPQKSMKAVLKPSMTIDHSNDYIYVVWAEKNGDSGMDVFCIQSSNHGASWTSRQRVNQDEWHTGRDQWDPAITWDQCTEALVVTYLDSRDGNDNSHAHTYASVLMKLPAATWQDVRVSDSPWGADFGTTPGYEYIGVAAGDGRAYPVWSDDRSGAFRPYVSPFLLWGVQQQSVTASATKNSDSTLSVTASWATNLPASKNDQIILASPNGVEYTSEPCSLCATNGGVSHDVTFDEALCEPGTWTYTVRSERSGCSMGRTSDRRRSSSTLQSTLPPIGPR